jgi:hypothetical protein
MAPNRQRQEPWCWGSRPVPIQDGTLCRMPSPLPGPVGAASTSARAAPILTLSQVKAAVLDAVTQNRIQGITAQLTAAISNGYFSDGGHRIYLADAIYYALEALSRTNIINIMSMMRYNHGYHGDTDGRADGSALCSAMDISEYAGHKLNLINGVGVQETIAGVIAVIDNLPPGLYGFGLTRPSPYPGGPPMNGKGWPKERNKDVFLPCWSLDPKEEWAMYTWGRPLDNPTPQFVNDDARVRVNDAIGRNPNVKVAQMFMDGPDHLHLHVWSAAYKVPAQPTMTAPTVDPTYRNIW